AGGCGGRVGPEPKACPIRRRPTTTAATRMTPRIVAVADITSLRSLAGSCSPSPGIPAPGTQRSESDPPASLAHPAKTLDQHWIVLQRGLKIDRPVQLLVVADRREPQPLPDGGALGRARVAPRSLEFQDVPPPEGGVQLLSLPQGNTHPLAASGA